MITVSSMSSSSSCSSKTVFVTVGTTLFEELIESTTTEQALDWMETQYNVGTLIVQYGKGREPQISQQATIRRKHSKLKIEVYDFKASLQADMLRADLILSHAGAGTVMEALRLQKHLVVVINSALMHNHQTELAHALGKRKQLFVVDEPSQLDTMETWEAFFDFVPKPHRAGDDYEFPRLLDDFLGFHSKES